MCKANTVSAVHNVKLVKAAAAAKIKSTFGQSPFALAHGQQFERNLFYKDAERLLEALIEKEVLPAKTTGFLDLRLKMNGGTKVSTLDDAIEETKQLLRRAADATTPAKRKALFRAPVLLHALVGDESVPTEERHVEVLGWSIERAGDLLRSKSRALAFAVTSVGLATVLLGSAIILHGGSS